MATSVARVAVAVRARMEAWGKREAATNPTRRYAGRKLWPHSVMQCASSTTSSDGRRPWGWEGKGAKRVAGEGRSKVATRPLRKSLCNLPWA